MKMRGKTLKYVLRRVARSYLPETILKRPKQGFMFPLGYWMRGPLLPVLEHLLDHAVVIEQGIFSRQAIARLLDEHLSRRADHHVRLWMILNVEVWYRLFVLGESLDDLKGLLAERLGSAA
jgi:asparagine synthase (glutamine-hydrolysing)